MINVKRQKWGGRWKYPLGDNIAYEQAHITHKHFLREISWQNSTGIGDGVAQSAVFGHTSRPPYTRGKHEIYSFIFNLGPLLTCICHLRQRPETKNREGQSWMSRQAAVKKNGNVWINEGWCLQLTNLAGRNWSRTRVIVMPPRRRASRRGGTFGPGTAPWQVDAVDV